MAAPGEKEQPKFDVYARPFIPQIFRAINQAAANIVTSTPAKRIDFGKYVQTFAGSDYLTAKTTSYHQIRQPNGSNQAEISDDKSSQITTQRDPDNLSLQAENYQAYFHTALEQEVGAQQKQCDDHALYRVPIIKNGKSDPRPNMYTLHVPGLREMSLRIEVGDIVQLRQLRVTPRGEIILPPSIKDNDGNAVVLARHAEDQHNSVVWNIDRRNETLSLRIDHMARISMLFNACFTVQSGRINALQRAVMAATDRLSAGANENWTRSILFPEDENGYFQKTLNRAIMNLNLCDKLLNFEQQKAVNTVLNEQYGPVPFIISGPPGTGKTKTIVELSLQKISLTKSEHLLLCAPSDPAADTLVQRLARHLGPSALLRINSPARGFAEVPSNILSYCCVDDGIFSLPPFKQIMGVRIIVTTCRDADVLVQARLCNADLFSLEQELHAAIHPNSRLETSLHWTGLLIDEAAQATEPEALIPLSVVAPPKNHRNEKQWPIFVMAGDQHQLGPRTASKSDAIQTSLFERILDRQFYREHPLARSKQSGGVMRPLTQDMLPIRRPPFSNLIRNYRSHPAILATPSSLFYNDTLEPEATQIESILSWERWKRPGWPVMFTRNTAADEIEQDGGGWYNIVEANLACQYAKTFLLSSLLQPHEICIMSPFQAQVKVIRNFARKNSMSGVNIGPLEAFQGLESRLVILCTTRTRNRFIDQDIAKGLGVIHEPKRFNVALTRAKEGLIVIGNPDVLSQDANWRVFLEFCARNQLMASAGANEGYAKNGEDVIVSRLERQLVLRTEEQDPVERSNGLANGVRKLGFVEDADQALWKSGVAIEASLKTHDDTEVEEDHSVEAESSP